MADAARDRERRLAIIDAETAAEIAAIKKHSPEMAGLYTDADNRGSH